jgi:hypothetical protein
MCGIDVDAYSIHSAFTIVMQAFININFLTMLVDIVQFRVACLTLTRTNGSTGYGIIQRSATLCNLKSRRRSTELSYSDILTQKSRFRLTVRITTIQTVIITIVTLLGKF